ncbi:MAG: FAD-dependent oxidoreductase [Deltaproteobacteria bacterium]|nr:FAD-dependent oxidoreductase [Deltaproteobacteria bacterium]
MADRFDCIIVGAGPAGCAAAYKLASDGMSVIVFERGEYPGSKNMSGGILYSTILNKLIPEFWKEAPVERHVTRRRYSMLSKDSEAALDVNINAFSEPPYNNSFTVLRAKFDRWFAKKAEDAGALIVTEAVVDGFITDNEKITGVKVRMEGGEVLAGAVILADGANSLLSEKAGLREKPAAKEMILGVKEIISLPKEVIEDRFSLEGGQGAALEFFGQCLGGFAGQGFIYTNADCLSVGIGCPISVLQENGLKPAGLIEAFKKHPSVRNLLRGGRIEEYGAHMIPEGGFSAMPELTKDGLILCGDAGGLVNPSLYKEGSNLAMASGVFAAETVIEAKKRGDFSKAALDAYVEKLENSFVLKDMKRFKDAPEILRKAPELFKEYPEELLELLRLHFTVSEASKDEVHGELRRSFKGKVPAWRLLKNLWKLRRIIS